MICHTSPISGIAAHGDRWVATAGYDNQLILWDQRTHSSVARAHHDHLVNQCAFSPDGDLIVSSSSDYGARLWSVPDLRLMAILGGHEDDVEMSVFAPSGQQVATASRDHVVRVFDLSGRQVVAFEGHTADVISVEWAADGTSVISSSDDGTIKRWSLVDGSLLEDIDLHGVETDTVAIHAHGTIYAGNDRGELLTIAKGAVSAASAHGAGVKRVVLDRQRDKLVTLSYDRTMALWDVAHGQPELLRRSGYPDDVWARSCAFAGESKLVFATFGATYREYDVAADRWSTEDVPATQGVNAVTVVRGRQITVGDAGVVKQEGVRWNELGSLCNFLTPAGDVVLTGGQLGRVFDAATGRLLWQHRSPLNCAATFVRDGVTHAVVGSYTGEAVVLRLDDDGVRHVADVPMHANAIKGVAVSGDVIFTVCADTSAAWYDASSLERIAHLPDAHRKIANGCAALPGGRFASVSRDLTLRIWDRDRNVLEVPTPHDHSIKCVASDRSGHLIVTGSYFGTISVFDTRTGTWRAPSRPTASGISSLCADDENKQFLASSYDGRVYPVSFDG